MDTNGHAANETPSNNKSSVSTPRRRVYIELVEVFIIFNCRLEALSFHLSRYDSELPPPVGILFFATLRNRELGFP